MKTHVFVLPGLHGTPALLDEFVRLAPPWAVPEIVPLPSWPFPAYPPLRDVVVHRASSAATSVVVGNSFSAPLAVLVAVELGIRVELLVLVNGFLTPPVRGLRAPGVVPGIVRFGIRPSLARWLLAGGDAPVARRLVAECEAASPAALASRLASLAVVDVRREFAGLACPLLALRGKRDRVVGRRHLAAMRALRADLEVEEIDAPHLLLETEPALAWERISEHFESAA